MKKITCVILVFSLFLMCGCSKRIDYDIKDSSVKITGRNNNTYLNPDNKEDGYCFVEINGVKYLPFGTQDKTITGDIVGDCIAYEDEDENCRYYEVIGHEEFIASFYTAGIMEQWEFFRSEKTIGEEVEIPSFIYDLGYDIWK